MKKSIFLVAVLFCAAFSLSAQERKWAVGIDTARTIYGIIAWNSDYQQRYFAISPSFERGFGKGYSLGLRSDMVFGQVGPADQEVAHIAFAATGRWYPVSLMEKVFVATEVGLSLGYSDREPAYRGMTFALRAGYKHLMGKQNRLYLEPSMAYIVAKSDPNLIPRPGTPNGWEAGLNVGFTF